MAKYEGTKLANFQPIEKVGTLEVLDIEIGAGREVEPGRLLQHITPVLCVKTG